MYLYNMNTKIIFLIFFSKKMLLFELNRNEYKCRFRDKIDGDSNSTIKEKKKKTQSYKKILKFRIKRRLCEINLYFFLPLKTNIIFQLIHSLSNCVQYYSPLNPFIRYNWCLMTTPFGHIYTFSYISLHPPPPN